MKKTFLKRIIPAAAICVMLWLLWLPLVTSGNLRMDSERMINTPESAMEQYTAEGRSALVLLLRLFGLTRWDPVRSGVLYLAFMTLTVILLANLLRRAAGWRDSRLILLFVLLYGTSPIWAFHGYFVLQLAPVGAGVLLATAAAGGDTLCMRADPVRPVTRILWEITAAAILTFCILIYQSLILQWLAVLLVLSFSGSLRNGKTHWITWILLIARTALCIGAALWISEALRGNARIGNMANQIRWGEAPFFHCLYRIAQEIGATLLMVQSRYFSLYTFGTVLMILAVRREKGLTFRSLRDRTEEGRANRYRAFCLAGLLALPFAMAFLLGNVSVPRSQFALQLIAAFFPVCCLAGKGKGKKLAAGICIAAVLIQAVLVVRLIHSDNLRAEHDNQAAERITEEMKGMDTGKPIVFLGMLEADGPALTTEKTDVFRRSYFEWTYEEEKPWSASAPALRILSVRDGKKYRTTYSSRILKRVIRESKGTPCYPEDGFVQEQKDCIVVHLSDYKAE